jgi:hypothetical protein
MGALAVAAETAAVVAPVAPAAVVALENPETMEAWVEVPRDSRMRMGPLRARAVRAQSEQRGETAAKEATAATPRRALPEAKPEKVATVRVEALISRAVH